MSSVTGIPVFISLTNIATNLFLDRYTQSLTAKGTDKKRGRRRFVMCLTTAVNDLPRLRPPKC